MSISESAHLGHVSGSFADAEGGGEAQGEEYGGFGSPPAVKPRRQERKKLLQKCGGA